MHWAVAVRILKQVLLMLILSPVVLPCRGLREWLNLRGDGPQASVGKLRRVGIGDLLCPARLLGRRRVDRGTVLRADIITLAVALRGIVGLEGLGDQLVEANLLRVVDDLHNLGVVGASGAGLAVGGIRRHATGEPDRRAEHARCFPKQLLSTPVTANPDVDDLLAFLPWAGDRRAEHRMRLRIFQYRVRAALERLIFRHQLCGPTKNPTHLRHLSIYDCLWSAQRARGHDCSDLATRNYGTTRAMVWVVRTLSLLSVNPHDPTAILPDLRAALNGEVSFLPVPLHDGTRASILRNSQRAGEPIDESIALVVGTSGSTGTPKGAQLTVDNLVSSATATHQWLGGEGQWLLAMPAYHIAGLQVLIRSLLAGTNPVCVDVTDGFDVAAFADGAEALTGAGAGDRAYTSLAPMQLAKALEEPFGAAALRLFDAVLVGGAALNPQVAARAEELGINVVTTYGSSETAGGCVYDGQPIEGAQVAIENGRVWLGGPMIAHGYRNAPGHEAFDKPGWFATSDAGEIRDGRLVITGRLDTIIDSGGLKLHPEVLERELLAIDGVTGACVVGVPHPRLGHAIVAAYEGTAELGDVMDGLGDAEDAGRINHWMIPKDLRRVEALPLIGPGKVDRKKVAALF